MISRRRFIASGASGLLLTGCDRLDQDQTFKAFSGPPND